MFPARASENAARPADSADGIMRTRERNPPLSRRMTFPQLSTGRPLPQRFQRFERAPPVVGIQSGIVFRHFKTEARVLVVPLSDGFESVLCCPRDDFSRRHGRLLSIVNTRLGTFRRALFVLVKNEAASLRL